MKIKTFAKRFNAILLAATMLFLISAPVLNADSTKEPILSILTNNIGDFEAGKKYDAKITLRNASPYGAYDLRLELIPEEQDKNIFKENIYIKDSSSVTGRNKRIIKIPFELREEALSGTHNMILRLKYRNTDKDWYTKDIPVNMYIKNNKSPANVLILDSKFENGIVDSSMSKMEIKVGNKGDFEARNVTLELKNFDPKGVFLSADTNIRKIDNLAKDRAKTFSFNIEANPDLDQDYELQALISYSDTLGRKFTKEAKILVPCSESQKQSKLSKLDIKFSEEEYKMISDKKKEIKLSLTNNSTGSMKNLKLELSANGGIVFMSKYIDIIDEIKAGETKEFTYKVVLSDPSSKGAFPIMATVKSGDSENASSKMEITSAIADNVSGGKKPKIIIADYSADSEKIIAGKEFELSIFMKNTSSTTGVKNCKVIFASESEVFIPIDAANSFFIERIAPGQTVEKKIKLISKSDAQAKRYKMNFSAEYEDDAGKSYDEKGNPFKSEESVVLNLSQEIRLEIPEFKIQPMAMTGENISLDIEFYNMGKAPLYNMMVKFEGDFECDIPNYFVGNFEASRTDMYSAKITAMEGGEKKGKLIFEFEDEMGNKQSVEKEFTINVEAMPEGGMAKDGDFMNPDFEKDGMPDEEMNMEFDENGMPIEKSQGLSTTWIIIIAVAGAVVVLIIWRVVSKKRKKKALEKLLLESDDED